MNRGPWVSGLLAALLLWSACSSDPTGEGPGSGKVVLSLATPNTDDGVLLFEVSGPTIDSVTPARPSLRLFARRLNDTSFAVVVLGEVAAGPVLVLHGPDGTGGIVTRLVEVADRQDGLRPVLTGYAFTVTP